MVEPRQARVRSRSLNKTKLTTWSANDLFAPLEINLIKGEGSS